MTFSIRIFQKMHGIVKMKKKSHLSNFEYDMHFIFLHKFWNF